MKQKITLAFSLAFITIVIFWACQDEELPEITGSNKIELTLIEDSTSYVFSEITCNLNQLPNFTIEQHGFCWDTVSSVNIEKQTNSFGNLTSQSFTDNIEELLPNKTYYVKAYIQNGDVVIYSNEFTIYTLDARPIVTTSEIINIKANRAESGGTVTAYETLFPITQRGVCWAKTTNPTIADSLTTNSTGNGTYVSEMQNLDIGANYFVRAYAINSEGISYGYEKSFSALDGIPSLTTDSIKNITATSAIFYGNITDNDGLEIIEKGFCWNTNTNPTIANNLQIVTGNSLGSFNAEITGLVVNTTFYVKAYIKNEAGTFYGNEQPFTTLDGLPSSLTTTEVTGITATTATSGGNITDDGGFAITARGICWSTNSNPTINDNKTTDGTGTGSFVSSLTGLAVNTTYYVRSYATNSTGTVYGNEQNFTTEDGLPSGLTTTAVTDITATTATSGGNITDNGGFDITARGVCWSTSTNPTIADAHTIDGTGTGSFISNITGLTEWAKYYIRAYATNENGVSYGEENIFWANTPVIDIDGNSYQTIKIGNQIWMAENLNVTHYSDGTEITGVYTYDYLESNADVYGRLYTWDATMNGHSSTNYNPSNIQGTCPDNWHVPSNSEWYELAAYISNDNGGYSLIDNDWENVGRHLKSVTGWNLSGNGIDDYGFKGLPGGCIIFGGANDGFSSIGNSALFITTTERDFENVYLYGLSHLHDSFTRTHLSKESGFSVRCIKD